MAVTPPAPFPAADICPVEPAAAEEPPPPPPTLRLSDAAEPPLNAPLPGEFKPARLFWPPAPPPPPRTFADASESDEPFASIPPPPPPPDADTFPNFDVPPAAEIHPTTVPDQDPLQASEPPVYPFTAAPPAPT